MHNRGSSLFLTIVTIPYPTPKFTFKITAVEFIFETNTYKITYYFTSKGGCLSFYRSATTLPEQKPCQWMNVSVNSHVDLIIVGCNKIPKLASVETKFVSLLAY